MSFLQSLRYCYRRSFRLLLPAFPPPAQRPRSPAGDGAKRFPRAEGPGASARDRVAADAQANDHGEPLSVEFHHHPFTSVVS
jgi:hypothetical protein